jgi:hypothetical protein
MGDSVTEEVRLAKYFEALAEIRKHFPPGFSVIAMCMKHGVSSIRLEEDWLLGSAGSYLAEEGRITLDPDLDREKIVAQVRKRHGLRIEKTEAMLWVFLHELGHAVRRNTLLGTKDRNARLHPTAENEREDQLAEEFARKEYLRWKRTVGVPRTT